MTRALLFIPAIVATVIWLCVFIPLFVLAVLGIGAKGVLFWTREALDEMWTDLTR